VANPSLLAQLSKKIELEDVSPDEHKRTLSDHYMVVSTLQVLADDDGPERSKPLVGPIGERTPFADALIEVPASSQAGSARAPSQKAKESNSGSLQQRVDRLESQIQQLIDLIKD
jgi:hypothetical protein